MFNRYWLLLFGLVFTLAHGAQETPLLSQLEGEWTQGAVLRGKVKPGTQVSFLGQTIPVGPDGEFVLGLGRDAGADAELILKGADDQWRHTYPVARRDYNIQRIEGVPQKTVTPSPEQQERTRREAAKVWQARQTERDTVEFMQDFKWPLIGPITGVYGSQRFYNGEPRSPHYGVDIAAPTGTRVIAPAAGEVILAEPDLFYSGGTLIVDHGHGLSSTFIHLSKMLVQVGDSVIQGQEIAEVGASGRATGPHLDWRMNWRGERVDPTTLVGPMPQ